jgi:hypothetical protein
MMIARDGCSKERRDMKMLFLLFLFIVPSAIGVYFLLKPPIEVETETDIKAVANVVTPFIGYEDISNTTVTGSNSMMRKQTVNE